MSISSLKDCDAATDLILICEARDAILKVKHHLKKLVFILSAMRHFANELSQKCYQVSYVKFDSIPTSSTLKEQVGRIVKKNKIRRLVVTRPNEYHTLQNILTWENDFGISVELKDDDRFLCSEPEFRDWAADRKQLRMELFYRQMRKKYAVLMEGDKPIGGQWNFDKENRKPPKEELSPPTPYLNGSDEITNEVKALVEKNFSGYFGDIEPFYFAVTRAQALKVLKLFISERLQKFGDYQDAMLEGEPWMYHSHISFYLNCGLLLPLECIRLAEKAYRTGGAPLNAVEGFIRQILGWREYVRGIYWAEMPSYESRNFLNARRNLPDFYWTGNTDLNCLAQCISETKKNAYAHHIQRLMILGNFALIAGLDPVQVNEWFLIVYADAYEWVELPNVSGMSLFADGGSLASKPYAAGGNYIKKMSNYCKNCSYSVAKKSGERACPFNYLYWDFLKRNREKLKSNHRVSMMYKTYDRMPSQKKAAIADDSSRFLEALT